MADELVQLLRVHEFLGTALTQHGKRLSRQEAARMERERDRVFLDILGHASDDASVTLAQLQFLMTTAVGLAREPELAEVLNDAGQRHIARLAQQLKRPRQVVPEEKADDFQQFDSLTDHVAVLDRHYQYVFTNRANAAFNNLAPHEFIGRSSWSVMGERFFEVAGKPRFDACLAGENVSYIAPHPAGDPSRLFAVNIDPIRDGKGCINRFMISARDVSGLPVPAHLIAAIA